MQERTSRQRAFGEDEHVHLVVEAGIIDHQEDGLGAHPMRSGMTWRMTSRSSFGRHGLRTTAEIPSARACWSSEESSGSAVVRAIGMESNSCPLLRRASIELDPVHVRHAKIQQDQVVRRGGVVDELKRVAAVEGRDRITCSRLEKTRPYIFVRAENPRRSVFSWRDRPPVEIAATTLCEWFEGGRGRSRPAVVELLNRLGWRAISERNARPDPYLHTGPKSSRNARRRSATGRV